MENRRDKAVIGVCDATLSELRRTDRHPVPMHSMTVREAFRRVGADEWDAVSERVFPQGFPALREVAAVVDDAAHGIWAGGNKEGPLTDLEWVEIRMNTYQLQAAATLVSIGGTGPADRGWATSPGFQERARKLSEAAVSARSAVTAKDPMALRTTGGTLVDVCNDCHTVFKPNIPTEGIFLKRGHDY